MYAHKIHVYFLDWNIFEPVSKPLPFFPLKTLRTYHRISIYRDANLPQKSAYFVSAMCRIHHRAEVYNLCRGHVVVIISIQCKNGINQYTRRRR